MSIAFTLVPVSMRVHLRIKNYINPFISDSQISPNVLHGISVDEYIDRRQNVGKKLLEFASREKLLPESGKWHHQLHMFINPSSQKRLMVDKIPYFFRQSTDLVSGRLKQLLSNHGVI